MERRPTRMDVTVHKAPEAPVTFQINNFCNGGALLMAAGEAAPFLAQLQVGDVVDVTTTALHKDIQVQARIRVVHRMEQGFGGAFLMVKKEFLDLLETHALPAADPAQFAAGSLEPLAGFAHEVFPDLFREVLAAVQRDFSEHLDQAMSSSELAQWQRDLHRLAGLPKDQGRELTDALLERVAAGLGGTGKTTHGAEAEGPAELSLLDQEVFEEWLQEMKLATVLYERFGESLHRLAQVLGRGTRVEDVPFSPSQIAGTLGDLSDLLEMPPGSRTVMFGAARRVLETRLGDIYKTLLDPMETMRPLFVHAAPGARVSVSAPDEATEGPAEPATAGSAGPAATEAPAGPAQASSEHGWDLTDMPAAQGPQPSGHPGTATPMQIDPAILTAFLSGHTSIPLPTDADLVEPLAELVNASEAEEELTPLVRERAAFAHHLLDFIREDAHLDSAGLPWVHRLQALLLRAFVAQPGFLSQPGHPLRRFLDTLEHLGMLPLEGEDGDRIPHLVEQALTGFQDEGQADETRLAEVVADLEDLVNTQSRRYQQRVERVVRASAGRERLRRIREEVATSLAERFGGHLVPPFFGELLDVGWRALLEISLLKQGRDGAIHLRLWQVLDGLVQWGEDRPATSLPRAGDLMRALDRALPSGAFDLLRAGRVLEQIRSWLGEEGPVRAASRIPFEAPPTRSEDDGTEPLEGIAPKAWRQALDTLRSLRVGDRLGLRHSGREPGMLRVAWFNDDHSRFALVDRKGALVEEVGRRELARRLCEPGAQVIPAKQMPLSERAVDAFLEGSGKTLSRVAARDPLTGLYNRPRFQVLLEKSLNRVREGAQRVLCWIQIEQLEVVNQSLGYQAGDRVLVESAELLRAHFNGLGVPAYIGGNLFAVLLVRHSLAEAEALAEAFRQALAGRSIAWGERRITVAPSIGLVDLSTVEGNCAVVLQAAEAAVFAARQAGGNRITLYKDTDEVIGARIRSLRSLQEVDRLLDNGDLRLRAQRIQPIDPAKGLAPHYEILLGAVGKDGKPVDIADFITAAEAFNRMAEVDRRIIETAFTWAAQHPQRLEAIGGLAINLSGQTVNDEGIVDFLADLFAQTGVPHHRISFEITETAAIGSLGRAVRVVQAIKEMGCAFALDDFGSGLASYTYLKRLPVDWLKIDGSFVANIASNPEDLAMVRSMNDVAHFLGKHTIAEYVKDDTILQHLREIGVDYAQGFGIEKPCLLEEIGLPKAPDRGGAASAPTATSSIS